MNSACGEMDREPRQVTHINEPRVVYSAFLVFFSAKMSLRASIGCIRRGWFAPPQTLPRSWSITVVEDAV